MPVDGVMKLEQELAYSAARSDIESFCVGVGFGDGVLIWFDTSRVDEGCEHEVARAIRYLSAMNYLIRNPERPACVRVKDFNQVEVK